MTVYRNGPKQIREIRHIRRLSSSIKNHKDGYICLIAPLIDDLKGAIDAALLLRQPFSKAPTGDSASVTGDCQQGLAQLRPIIAT